MESTKFNNNCKKITMKRLNELSKEIHETNVKNGFYEEPNSHTTQRMLILSELYEAFEAHRKDNFCDSEALDAAAYFIYERKKGSISLNKHAFKIAFLESVKDTIEDEIADTAIRLLDYGCYLGVYFDDMSNQIIHKFSGNFIDDLDFLINTTRMKLQSVNMVSIAYLFSLIEKFANHYNIDLEKHIILKLEYNKTRQYKHGKNY